MRIVLISDTHSLHRNMTYDVSDFIDPNSTNVIIHSGDMSNIGQQHEVEDFISWFKTLDGFDYKIFIAGNHDLSFENKLEWLEDLLSEENLGPHNCFYLEDSEMLIVDGEFSRPIKVYGSPWQPFFHNWAFNLPRGGDGLNQKWLSIPEDVDILITHGPPFGIRDNIGQIGLGCYLLKRRIEQLKPILSVFGHIHGGAGGYIDKDGTMFVNASTCTEKYKPTNKPIVAELKEVDNKITVEHVEILPTT